jgi:hypothetical protein
MGMDPKRGSRTYVIKLDSEEDEEEDEVDIRCL